MFNIIVNRKGSTLITNVCDRISSSISGGQLIELLAIKDESWRPIYMKILQQMYGRLINEASYTCICIKFGLMLEPIQLFEFTDVEDNNKKTTFHVFDESLIRQYLFTDTNFHIKEVPRPIKNETIPPVFEMKMCKEVVRNAAKLSPSLSKILLDLYVLAEHASIHYTKYRQTGDMQYDHQNWTDILRKSQKIHTHSIITRHPNETIEEYTKRDQYSKKNTLRFDDDDDDVEYNNTKESKNNYARFDY